MRDSQRNLSPRWPPENRPTELDQDKRIYNPPTAASANIFRNLA
jgi:hypothetical protein